MSDRERDEAEPADSANPVNATAVGSDAATAETTGAEAAFAEYLRRVDRGEPVDRQSFCAAHPECAGELASDLDLLEEVGARLRSHDGGRVEWLERVQPVQRVEESPPPRAGDFAGLDIITKIHQGARSAVYRAWRREPCQVQVVRRQMVALKVVSCDPALPAGSEQRFLARAGAAASLGHQSLVPVYDFGTDDGLLCVTMPLLTGGSLAERLPLAGALGARVRRDEQAAHADLLWAVETVACLADAVDHVHGRGLVHGNIKPRNVFLEGVGDLGGTGRPGELGGLGESHRDQDRHQHRVPMLSDLALAGRDGAPTGRTMLAALGEGAGYLAPEQAASCHIGGQLGGPAVPAMPAAATADIYALGALLYALLVGRPPHLGATPLDTLLLAVGQPVTPPRRLLPGLDRRLEAICMRCLETAPEKRYPTAGELCNALRLYLC